MRVVERMLAALGSLLASRHWMWLLPALCGAFYFGTLDTGLIADDHWHRAALTSHPELPTLHKPMTRVFTFVHGDSEELAELVGEGILPWWSDPELRLSLYRPLASLSLAMDYAIWPENSWAMHAHSLVWYLALVIAGLVFYRRVLPSAAVAGLAALLYAVDDGMTLPVVWIANRNALMGLLFGLVSLTSYHRWRQDGWRPGSWLAPLTLAAAVLANEGAVAIGGYLVGYALFMDPAPWRRRLLALVPCTAVGLVWGSWYLVGGFGTWGSGVYVVPGTVPFLGAMAERVPLLLLGQWAFPPADMWSLLSSSGRIWMWTAAVTMLPLLAAGLWPLLRRERQARFLIVGMIAALVPAASTFPSDRLLLFGGIGAAGLLAMLLSDLARVTRKASGRGLAIRCGAGSVAGVLVLVHVGLSLGLVYPTRSMVLVLDRLIQRTAMSVPRDAAVAGQTLIVVSSSSSFVTSSARILHADADPPKPRAVQLLASSIHGSTVRRSDPSTLVIRPRGGFLPPSHVVPEGIPDRIFDYRRSLQMLDAVFRNTETRPFSSGDIVETGDFTVEVLSVEDGRPMEVAFRFIEPLDSDRWRWVIWIDGAYVPFVVPPVGGEVVVEPLSASVPLTP